MVSIKTVLNLLTYCVALIGFIPLFPYLENVARIAFPLGLAAGSMADKGRFRIPTWIPTVISLIFFVFYAAQFTRENLVGPAVNLLIILLSVRLFSEKTSRNYLQIFALSLFSLTSSSLFSLSPVFLVYLFLMLALIAVSLVILTFCATSSQPLVSRQELRKVMSVALVMPAAALPLMAFLFIILPRTQFPLWNFLNVGGGRETGFSEKVEPGGASTIGEVKKVAFRASCERQPLHRLYWRSIVLNSLEGHAWVRKEMPRGEEGGVIKGKIIQQTIYPEPGRTAYLAALNIPRAISGIRAARDSDYTFTARRTMARIKYDAVSVDSVTIEARSGIDRRFYLHVPEKLSPRFVQLGKDVAARGKNDEGKIALLEDFFTSRKLMYATTGLPVGENSLEEFLLTKGRGNCEFFASSFALLLRLAGVPSRLVGGYFGGDYSDIGGYYVVSEDMAHVWVEAYQEGMGWVMIDPSRWSVNFAGAREHAERSFLRRAGLAVDAFSYYWNRAVINYDLQRQIQLISSANTRMKNLPIRSGLKAFLWFAVAAAAVVIGAVVAKRRGKRSREERILSSFLRKVRRKYRVEFAAGMGLFDLSATVDDPAVTRFVALYAGAIYRDRELKREELRELDRLIGDIGRTKSGTADPANPGAENAAGGRAGRLDKP